MSREAHAVKHTLTVSKRPKKTRFFNVILHMINCTFCHYGNVVKITYCVKMIQEEDIFHFKREDMLEKCIHTLLHDESLTAALLYVNK